MTKEQIDIAVKKNKLQKDELDNLSDNIVGTGTFVIVSLIAICGAIYNLAFKSWIHSESELAIVMIGAILVLFYTIWTKLTERKLLSFKTNYEIKKEQIQKIANINKWEILKKNNCCYVFSVSYGINSSKLTIILKDNAIYYNIRPKGSYHGRLPHLFGLEILLKKKIKRQINDYIQQAIIK